MKFEYTKERKQIHQITQTDINEEKEEKSVKQKKVNAIRFVCYGGNLFSLPSVVS